MKTGSRQIIERIDEKLKQLGDKQAALRKENKMLRKLNEDLAIQVNTLNNELKNFMLAHDSLKESEKQKEELKNLIDKYIQEIDECLQMIEGRQDEDGRTIE